MESALVRELKSLGLDAIDWNGDIMRRWDEIRRQVETLPGSDVPRLNFEGLMEGFAEKLGNAVVEIEKLQAALYPFALNYQIGSGYCRDDFKRASEAIGPIDINALNSQSTSEAP